MRSGAWERRLHRSSSLRGSRPQLAATFLRQLERSQFFWATTMPDINTPEDSAPAPRSSPTCSSISKALPLSVVHEPGARLRNAVRHGLHASTVVDTTSSPSATTLRALPLSVIHEPDVRLRNAVRRGPHASTVVDTTSSPSATTLRALPISVIHEHGVRLRDEVRHGPHGCTRSSTSPAYGSATRSVAGLMPLPWPTQPHLHRLRPPLTSPLRNSLVVAGLVASTFNECPFSE